MTEATSLQIVLEKLRFAIVELQKAKIRVPTSSHQAIAELERILQSKRCG